MSGVLVGGPGWRWIFLINVPAGIALAGFVLTCVPKGERARRGSADVLGAVTVTTGMLGIVYAINKSAGYGWTSPTTLGVLAGGAAMLGLFVIVEQRVTAPLIPLSMFRLKTLTTANIVAVLVMGSFFGTAFQITLFLQQVLGYSPLRTGAAGVYHGHQLNNCRQRHRRASGRTNRRRTDTGRRAGHRRRRPAVPVPDTHARRLLERPFPSVPRVRNRHRPFRGGRPGRGVHRSQKQGLRARRGHGLHRARSRRRPRAHHHRDRRARSLGRGHARRRQPDRPSALSPRPQASSAARWWPPDSALPPRSPPGSCSGEPNGRRPRPARRDQRPTRAACGMTPRRTWPSSNLSE